LTTTLTTTLTSTALPAPPALLPSAALTTVVALFA
jgi:hypothetical protein